MDFVKLLQRTLIVSLLVALGAATTVYFMHDWFHSTFNPAPMADAIGVVFILAVAFIAQRLVSIAIYKDSLLGLNVVAEKGEGKQESFGKVAEEVSAELKLVHDFNEVVRGRLKSVLSKAIVYFRELLGMTQEMLAEASGLSPSAIKRMEKGRKRGGWTDTMEDACDGLGITIIELFGVANRLAMQETA